MLRPYVFGCVFHGQVNIYAGQLRGDPLGISKLHELEKTEYSLSPAPSFTICNDALLRQAAQPCFIDNL